MTGRQRPKLLPKTPPQGLSFPMLVAAYLAAEMTPLFAKVRPAIPGTIARVVPGAVRFETPGLEGPFTVVRAREPGKRAKRRALARGL